MKFLLGVFVLSVPMICYSSDQVTLRFLNSNFKEPQEVSAAVYYRCYNGMDTSNFAFSIRKDGGISSPSVLAYLVFADHTAYVGTLKRSGLDMRFRWSEVDSDDSYTVVVKGSGAGYYYNWSLADKDGTMTVKRTLTCRGGV